LSLQYQPICPAAGARRKANENAGATGVPPLNLHNHAAAAWVRGLSWGFLRARPEDFPNPGGLDPTNQWFARGTFIAPRAGGRL
jgi:hypothetical protein